MPSGQHYSTGSGHELFFDEGNWVDDEALVAHAFQRYQLQLGFTDRQLGRLIERLKRIGLYDRALILVFADHGFGLDPGGSRRSVNRQNFSDILLVPLFVRFPGQTKGVVSEVNAELVDLLPTIAEVLDLPIGWRIDGVSLLAEAARRSDVKLLFKRGSSIPWIVDHRVEKLLRPTLCVDGLVYPQTSEGVVGTVDSVEISETEIEIQGKTGDAQLGRPASGVCVFLNDQLIQQAQVDEKRPEVASFYNNPRLLHSGFRVHLDRSLLERDPSAVLRLFAWDSKGASELVYPQDYRWQPRAAFEIPRHSQLHSCTPGVSGLMLIADETATRSTEESSVERLKLRAIEAGSDLILPPVAFPELVGLNEDELGAEPAEFWVEIGAPGLLDSKRAQARFGGVEVRGWVNGLGALPDDAHLLLIFNGVVTSGVPLFEDSAGESRFVGLLPEQAESLDRLSFYLVWREGEQSRLLKPTPSSQS